MLVKVGKTAGAGVVAAGIDVVGYVDEGGGGAIGVAAVGFAVRVDVSVGIGSVVVFVGWAQEDSRPLSIF